MHYIRQGQVADRPHLNLPSGTFEEEHGLDGFFGAVSHLYHRNPPTSWSSIEASSFQWKPLVASSEDFLKPRCFGVGTGDSKAKNFFEAGQCWFWNNEVRIWKHRLETSSAVYFRNADASELYFCHLGSLRLESVYGELEVSRGDYVLIPKGVTYRWKTETPVELLRIESLKSPYQKPATGILGQQALYTENDIQIAQLKDPVKPDSESVVRVQKSFRMTDITYPFDIRQVAGWSGSLYPFKLPILKIAPAMSPMAHLPPSINSTFVAADFIVCSFLPRPLEEPAGALKVPFFHSNIDYDEVIFYHDGDFFSRDGMEAGCMTLHPRGVHHGPHPKALLKQDSLKRTEEIAVMIDTKNELFVTAEALNFEKENYWKSWKGS
jgi:homogentisate 1,2-dioxygenase